MNKLFDQFKNVVVYDYEYKFTPGNPPEPVCVVYKELHTGQITKNWLVGEDNKKFYSVSPFPVSETLFIAHYSNAEVSCDLAMGYEKPIYIYDLISLDKRLTFMSIRQLLKYLDAAFRNL